MNLFYLAQKRSKILALSEKAKPTVKRIGSRHWRGLELIPDGNKQVHLTNVTAYQPFRSRSETIGWYATAPDGEAELNLWFAKQGSAEQIQQVAELHLDRSLTSVALPWSLSTCPGPIDLIIHVPARSKGPVFLAVHHDLDRQQLISLCSGRGIEIGPGPRPQILPADGIEVSYIEQMPPEEWERLYGAHYSTAVDRRLWENYVVGEAHDLPVANGSLDFIFASHVFEHLVNPLGHLEIWAAKLRKGGKIALIIPDYIGSKDYFADASSLSEFLAEYERGSFAPTMEHYERFGLTRGSADIGRTLFQEKSSIHVHFYTNWNTARLLEEACKRFRFQEFAVIHTPNHKDFYVTLTR